MAAVPKLPETITPVIPEEVWEEAAWLPCVLSVDLPLGRFTVRDLLLLEPDSILESKTAKGADVPVMVNTQRIGWAEFEVVGHRLAIRLTELA